MADNNILQYKGQPMARCGNKIYYGDPSQKAILVLTILDSSKYALPEYETGPGIDLFIHDA